MKKDRGLYGSGRIHQIPVHMIRPNPAQPRKIFEQEGLRELADSIHQLGIVQPLTVRKTPTGFELVAGERRLRAARLAGLTQVPCIVLAVDEEVSGMVALVENLQRRDLDYIEQAEGLARLMHQYGLSQEQAARRVGKSQSAVANKLRLLRHSAQVLQLLRQHELSERHARALLRLDTEAERIAAIEVIVSRQLNVARTEAYIEQYLQRATAPKKGMRKLIVRDVRLFLNSVSHSLELIRGAGIDVSADRREDEHEIVLTIRLPKGARPA